MSARVDEVLRRCQEQADAWISTATQADGLKEANARRASTLCTELLKARPPQRPTAERIAEAGQVRYPRFPRPQTLWNHYRQLLRIWVSGYEAIIDITAPRPRQGDGLSFARAELMQIPQEFRIRIELLLQVLKEREKAIARKDHLIRQSIPVTLEGGSVVSTDRPTRDHATIREWLTRVEAGSLPLELGDRGIVTTLMARPGSVIMNSETVRALRKLLAPLEGAGRPALASVVAGPSLQSSAISPTGSGKGNSTTNIAPDVPEVSRSVGSRSNTRRANISK